MKVFTVEDLSLENLINNEGEVLKVIQGDIDFYYKVHMKNETRN